jgi:hypothetical protein
MNNKMERITKVAAVAYFKVLSRNLPVNVYKEMSVTL